MNTHTLLAALHWHERGITPLPIIPSTKRALVKWKHWQNRRPPRALVRAWFSRPCRLALMCGATSNNLVVLDFDNLDLFNTWQHIHSYHYAHSYQVATSRPGMHVYVWCDELPPRTLQLPDVDVKCSGYVLAPPSTGYEQMNGNEILRASSVDVLLPGLPVGPSVEAEKAENGGGGSAVGRPIGRTLVGGTSGEISGLPIPPFSAIFGPPLGAVRLGPGIAWRIKQHLSILDACNLYTKMELGSNGYYWGRCPSPGHEDKSPSFSCDEKKGRAHCWSPGCRLHTEDGLDVIDLVSVLEGLTERDTMAMMAIRLSLAEYTEE